MLDIKLIRNQFKEIEQALAKRGKQYPLQEVVSLDKQRREHIAGIESLREKRNVESEKISKLKQQDTPGRTPDKEMDKIIAEMNKVREQIKAKEKILTEMDTRIKDILLSLPNIPDETVPAGTSEKDNKVIRQSGEPATPGTKVLPHWEIGERLGILDFNTAAKISGSRFTMLRGNGCRLERALINFMIDVHIQQGYAEVFPPYLVNKESMTGTGQLPKFEEELFKCRDDELYLIPTAEVSVTNIHRNEILDEARLPVHYVCYSACFRREAGSYGKDTKGLIRNHQFNKVELVKIVKPEDSPQELEKLTADAEEVLRQLEIPYRVVELCTGDIGFGAAKTYDLEVWMPGENRWREISSCTNYRDFQARRLNIKCKRLKGEKPYAHTINGSGVAVGRAFAAILENHQQPDGTVTIPSALKPYMAPVETFK